MNACCLRLFVLVCSFWIFGSTIACPGDPIPVHLLGKNAYNKEVDFQEFLAVIDVAPSPDSDLLNVDGMWESWFIVDKNRNYFDLSAQDGVINGIVVHDTCLVTKEGLRVGDSFSKVMAVYPDAVFKQGNNFVEDGVFDLVANDGKVELLFATRVVLDLIKDGYRVDLKDEVVQELRVSSIIIYQ